MSCINQWERWKRVVTTFGDNVPILGIAIPTTVSSVSLLKVVRLYFAYSIDRSLVWQSAIAFIKVLGSILRIILEAQQVSTWDCWVVEAQVSPPLHLLHLDLGGPDAAYSYAPTATTLELTLACGNGVLCGLTTAELILRLWRLSAMAWRLRSSSSNGL